MFPFGQFRKCIWHLSNWMYISRQDIATHMYLFVSWHTGTNCTSFNISYCKQNKMAGKRFPETFHAYLCFYSAVKVSFSLFAGHFGTHKPLGKIEVAICMWSPDWLPILLMANVWSGDFQLYIYRKEYGHTWHRRFLLRPGKGKGSCL